MTKRAIAAAVFCLFCISAFSQTANPDPSAPSWTRWRGPNGNGVVEDTGWDPGAVNTPRVVWKTNVGQGYSSVCVIGGFLYTAGMRREGWDSLLCLDVKTGAEVWSFPCSSTRVEYPGSRATPVFDNGKLYLMSVSGRAYCVDARTGAKIWETDIAGKTRAARPTSGFASSALIEGNLAVFNICASGVALDKETGSVAWKSGTTAPGYATPVAFNDKGARRLAMLGSKQLAIVEAATGLQVASTPWVTDSDVNVGDPVIIGDTVFLGTNYGHGTALFKMEEAGLTPVWSDRRVDPHFASAVYVDGWLYGNTGFAGEGNGGIFCMNAKYGYITWYEPLGVGSLIAVGSRLLIATETGSLIVAEARSERFSQIARAEKIIPRLCWTAPVLVGGRIFLRNDKGDLVCLDVSPTH
jgi:outer membrane protein assembly factor BamB